MRRSRVLGWITGVAIIIGSAWIAWNNFSTTALPPPPMSLALVLKLQNQADESCKCSRRSGADAQKSRDCWNEFKADVKTYDKIEGPEAVAGCVGWSANDTLTFGPPVAKRREKERRYRQFMDNLSEKEKSEAFSVPPEIDIFQDDEIGFVAPEWTVTTRRIHGGCSAQEERKLAEAKRVAHERKVAAGQRVAPSCG